MCREETIPDGEGMRRSVTEGDILVLVQGRNRLFHQIIAFAKGAGLEVAGADRLLLSAELATKDIVALLSFLALPEDDLSLAAALRSSIFGLSEGDLFNLAARRKSTLWASLRAAEEAYPRAVEILRDLLRVSDFHRPFELIQRILVRHGGRARLIARLGPEAEDGIDAFIDLALGFEQNAVPSLTGFLDWWERESVEIKRQSGGGGKLRVMTVHGAKGLEAPIVILPDTFRDDRDKGGPILAGPHSAWIKGSRGSTPRALRDLAEARAKAQEAERHRLLYVAMTRAKCWLIACGAGMSPPPETAWYRSIEAGMLACGAVPVGDIALRVETGDWLGLPVQDRARSECREQEIPAWVDSRPAAFQRPPPTITPSDLGGEKVLPGTGPGREDARLSGTRIHRLLEVLPDVPEDTRAERAERLLEGLDDAEIRRLTNVAIACIEAPQFSEIFSKGAMVEVGIVAPAGLLGPGNFLARSLAHVDIGNNADTDGLQVRATCVAMVEVIAELDAAGGSREIQPADAGGDSH